VSTNSGYTGIEKRYPHESRQVIWQIAARRRTNEKQGKYSAL